MSDQFKFKLWEWAEWGSKLLITAIAALLWQIYVDVQKTNEKLTETDRRMTIIEARQESFLTKQEALEMMKRTELLIQTLVKDEEIKRLKEKQ